MFKELFNCEEDAWKTAYAAWYCLGLKKNSAGYKRKNTEGGDFLPIQTSVYFTA
jgi:hypothetical protein